MVVAPRPDTPDPASYLVGLRLACLLGGVLHVPVRHVVAHHAVARYTRGMKTLLNAKDKEKTLARLQRVRPTSQRLWGKMSAHQMVCHLSDGFKMYMGLKPVSPANLPYPRSLLKWIALWAPIPWPKGFNTAPELDQQLSGTPPVEFEKDMNELQSLVDRFAQQPRSFQWQAHPQFGKMSEKEWMRLGYLHMDHHLRQFGA